MKLISNPEQLKGYSNTTLGMRKQKRVPLITGSTILDETTENMKLLEECRRYWDSLNDFRTRRLRARKYYRGDQWGDYIKDPDSDKLITEEEYLKKQGKVPLKQNRIRQLGKTMIGLYRGNPAKSIVLSRSRDNAQVTEMLTNALQAALQNNMSGEVDTRIFEEFLQSGAIVQKVGYKYFKERNLEDLYIENVSPNRLFFNSDVSDIRLNDLRIIGEIIDTTIDNLVSTFAKTKADEEKIRDIYAGLTNRGHLADRGLSPQRIDNLNFFISSDPDKARVFEIWYLKGEWKTYAHDPIDGTDNIVPYTMKEIAEQNRKRIEIGLELGQSEEEIPLIEARNKYEQSWYVKYLSPLGHCLYEGITPYKHEEHPYALTLYPLLDGEVWGFVEDIIDQQRYINRLIIMMDFIMSASAKGVLMIPEDCIPDGMTERDFADEWARFNGVIVYKPNTAHGKGPEQISSKSTNVGISEMIALQMSLIQEISGVHDAIQGKNPNSGTPAALYAQEAQNSAINTLDYMATFQAFQQKRDTKALKVITQYYKSKRYLAINGRSVNELSKLYDPELVRNIDFDIVVTQGQNTPVYRQIVDQTLFELLQGNLIDIEMYLEQTSLPFADKLLAAIKQRKEQLAQTGTMDALPPELMAQVNKEANPQGVQMANKVLARNTQAA